MSNTQKLRTKNQHKRPTTANKINNKITESDSLVQILFMIYSNSIDLTTTSTDFC